jgi:hypothetical protein
MADEAKKDPRTRIRDAEWEARDLLQQVPQMVELPALLAHCLKTQPQPREGMAEVAMAMGCPGWVVDALVEWEKLADGADEALFGDGWRYAPEAERVARAERVGALLARVREAIGRGPRMVRVWQCNPRDAGSLAGSRRCPVVRETSAALVARVEGKEVEFDLATGWRKPHDKRKAGLRLHPNDRRPA